RYQCLLRTTLSQGLSHLSEPVQALDGPRYGSPSLLELRDQVEETRGFPCAVALGLGTGLSTRASTSSRCGVYSSMAPPIPRRCSRRVTAGLEARRARNSANRSCARSDVPRRIFAAWAPSVSRMARALLAISSARATGRNTTPFTSPIAISSVPTVQE